MYTYRLVSYPLRIGTALFARLRGRVCLVSSLVAPLPPPHFYSSTCIARCSFLFLKNVLSLILMKEAQLYQKLPHQQVECLTCPHRCILEPGQRGLCGVRENQKGKLYSLVYGKIVALDIDPIEKKPLFHFLPGTNSLSLGTVGCQFRCLSCQNWEISQSPKLTKQIQGKSITPKQIIALAQRYHLPSVSYTYNDPIVFLEYALDIMKLAHQEHLKNVWVTSGYLTPQSLELIFPYLDAANVDLKGFSESFYNKYCGGHLAPVLNILQGIKKKNIWLEVTTLVIPTLNDSEAELRKIAEFIYHKLGAETPWHISRFFGDASWKLQNISPTPLKTLEKASEIGREVGLKYVYLGNVPDLDKENTYCPHCQAKVVERHNYQVKRYDKNGKCPYCGADLNIID